MLYFKKAELAETYHVSEKTITNWIREAKMGKLSLELYEVNGKAWIANTTSNIARMEQLVEARRKFRNSRAVKVITPSAAFYEMYTPRQILDISYNLDMYHEVPFQYGYFEEGAEYWDKYAERLASEESPNNLNVSVKQLQADQGYIDNLLAPYRRINIVDIGAGNARPVKDFLQHLLDQGKLARYIAADISPAMIEIAGRNIQKWFGGAVQFEGLEMDINYDRFNDVLATEVMGPEAKDTINVVLAFGGTLTNLRSPDGAMKVIHDSMNRNDLFIYTRKLDTQSSRRYFDFSIAHQAPTLDQKSKMVLDALNLDDSLYETEMGYDPDLHARYMRVRLKVSLTMKFTFESGERLIEFNKNDTILVWRSWHQSTEDVLARLTRNDFDVLQLSHTEDKGFLLTISRVKSVQ